MKVYNSLSQKKEDFVPLVPGQVKMYCCGPTVYDLLHVGNFRGAIFYNFVRNWLESKNLKVTYVYNYTDVDDKIIHRAQTEGVTSESVAEKYMAEFKKDFASLELKPHSFNPTVTEHMNDIITFISDLIAKEKAYVVNGEVLYSISAFENYGCLSHRKPEDMKAGSRIEVNTQKKDPLDFALWKPMKPGEPAWDSPWGPGRPGWHIECSAMAKALLGEQIDIHGGGMDLIFPHHENEIAQSEGASGKQFVKYWMHNNMLEFGGAKMSKSLGNVKSGRDFMTEYHPEILKYMLLSVHYRSISDFSEEGIQTSLHGLARIYSSLALAQRLLKEHGVEAYGEKGINSLKLNSDYGAKAWLEITESFDDDFNTPKAFGTLFELIRAFNTKYKLGIKLNADQVIDVSSFIHFVTVKFGNLMSLFQKNPIVFLTELDDMLLKKKNLKREDINALVAKRAKARADKNFALSDEIRAQLTQMEILVSDTTQGSVWEVLK